MHHQPLVRVFHRRADALEQFDARACGEVVRVAPCRNRVAVDKLHDQKRTSVGCSPSIQQARDTRVFETSQDLAFGMKPSELAGRFMAQQLQSATLGEALICSRGQVDLAHAATTDQAINLPRAEACASRQRSGERTARGLVRINVQYARCVMRVQQRFNLLAQTGVIRASALKKCDTRGSRQGQ